MSKRTKAEIFEASRQRRQAILDYLHACGPTKLSPLAEALDVDKTELSMHLHTMYRRGEIVRANVPGRFATWKAAVEETFRIDYDPAQSIEKARAAQGLLADRVASRNVPGLRVVRLLDRQGHSTGGQCAGNQHGSLQCNFSERSVRI